jgi:hypothetical protein
MDILRYSNTVHAVCTRDYTRRQIHDLVRLSAVYGSRVHVCSCISDPWARASLSFLGTTWTPVTKQCNTLPTSAQ